MRVAKREKRFITHPAPMLRIGVDLDDDHLRLEHEPAWSRFVARRFLLVHDDEAGEAVGENAHGGAAATDGTADLCGPPIVVRLTAAIHCPTSPGGVMPRNRAAARPIPVVNW